MNKSYIAAFFLASLCLALAPVAFCSDITGEVRDAQGNPEPGVQITCTDSSGKQVAQATTNNAGWYCITGLDPGTYTCSATPPTGAGVEAGSSATVLPAEGLNDNWTLSPSAVALSSANSPGVCSGLGWGPLGALGLGPIGLTALGVGTAGAVGAGAAAAAGAFNGGPSSASK